MKLFKLFLITLLSMVVGVAKAITVNVSLNPSTNGTFSGESSAVSGYYTTWTSNAASGLAGVVITTGGKLAMCQQTVNSYGGNLLALKTSSSNTEENIVITAPEDYVIIGYELTARLYSSSADSYKIKDVSIKVNGTDIREFNMSSSELTLTAQDTKGNSANYLCITSFKVHLEKPISSLDVLTTGWYRIRCVASTRSYKGYLKNVSPETVYNTTLNYPIGIQASPAAVDAGDGTYYFYLTKTLYGHYIQVANGHYVNNAQPTSALAGYSCKIGYDEGGFYLYSSFDANKYFVPYEISGVPSVGESTQVDWAANVRYEFHPVNLEDEGVAKWVVSIEDGMTESVPLSGNTQVICSNSAVKGISTVYNNGYFFFPSGTVPSSSDFSIGNSTDNWKFVVNSTAKTITAQKVAANELTGISQLTTGWYQIAFSAPAADAGRYWYNTATDWQRSAGECYAVYGQVTASEPESNDPAYYIRVEKSGSNYYVRSANGHYLDTQAKTTTTPTAISVTYDDATGAFKFGNYWKYYSSISNIIGWTSVDPSTREQVFSIDPADEGLDAWQVVLNNFPDNTQLTCNNANVKGNTKAYNGGYFFFATDEVIAASDFAVDGVDADLYEVTIDAESKTITFVLNPAISIIDKCVSISQGYQTTGRGNANAILLRVTLSPLQDATDVKLNVTLKDDALTAASRIAVYELASATPEFYAQTLGNSVASVDNPSSSDIQLNIGTFTQSTPRYLWLTADVKNDAPLGSIIDAAIASITYTCNETETTFELTSGDPVDRGAMVLDVQQYLFLPTTDDAKCYRIPAMIVADDGSILAAVDKRYANHNDIGNGRVIDIVLRRSTDGGKTWSDVKTIAKGQGSSNLDYCAYGDPTLVKCTDGTIISTACVGNLGFTAGLNRFSVMKSTDNGVTWTDPVDVTSVSGMLNNKAGLTDFFITSGKGLCTSDGVIMYLALSSSYKSYVVYSVDKGEHWVIDDQVVISSSANEAKLEQMNDGTLIASSRNASAGNRLFNKGSYVNNDGTLTFTWGTQYGVSALSQSGANNQDILYYSRANEIGSGTVGASTGNPDILLHTMTSGNHANLKLFMSIDQANTWTEVMQIQPNGARYATMQRLSNGDLAILFEDGALGQNDYNNAATTGYQYPINYITITKAQIEALYAEMTEVNTTFHILDVAGATLLEKEETVMGVQTEIPTSLKRAFCTYTMYSDEAMTQQISKIGSNTDVYVKCEYSGPVEFSTVENPKWYFLYSHKQNDTKDYVAYTENNEFKMAAASFFDSYSNKAYQWAFIGNPYDVRVLNRGNNGYLASSAMKAASNNQSFPAYVTTDVSAYPYYSFSLYGFSNSQVNVDNPFSLFLDPVQGTFLNGSNGNLYYHTSVVPSSELKLTNWKDANLMVLEVPATYPVTLNTVGSASYATLYLPFDVTTDADTKAYVIKEVGDGSAKMTELTGGEIAARTAVVLVNETSNSATFNVASGLSPQVTESENLLKGTLVSRELDLAEGNGNYSLGRLDGQIGFIKYKNGENTTITLGANKAYLKVPASSGNVKGFTLGFGGDDGIGQVVSDESVNGTWYDLNGRRLSGAPAAKGVYIVGGKKVIVK